MLLRFSKVRATNLDELCLKARYAEDLWDEIVESIISDLIALGAKPKASAPKEAKKRANMLATRDRIRLRYRTLKLRALCWVLQRLRAGMRPGLQPDHRRTYFATRMASR